MNFDLSEEQQLLADSVRRFVERDYTFEARKKVVASDSGYSPDVWKTLADLGLLALPIPTDHGGFGGGAVDLMPVMEAFGEALVVEPYLSTVMCAHILCHPRAGGDPVASVLSAVAEGKMILALAQTEDNARYDLNHVATTAEKDGDAFILNGTKRVVLHATQADRLLVSARSWGEVTDEAGISLFLVDPKAGGINMTAYRTIDELVGADVEFRRVRVQRGAMIGAEGKALELIEEGVDFGTALLCAEAVGAMKYACDATLEYLKTRKQFGVPIGSFQALQHRMVDMTIELEQARSMASLAATSVSAQKSDGAARATAAAKVRIATACERVSQEAIQLHGGMGMTEELKVSHTFRRLTSMRGLFGDSDHHLARIEQLA